MSEVPDRLPEPMPTRAELLAEADRIVAALSPGKREGVREIVIDATGRGFLTPGGRAFLDRATGGTLVADVLDAVLEERRQSTEDGRGDAPLPVDPSSDSGGSS